MACIGPEIEESALFLIEIQITKFLTEFDEMPKVADQFRDKKSSITLRANSRI
jgi:hypothetical protein